MNGSGPGSETQHSQDEGPDELVGGLGYWHSIPGHPCVVYKTLHMLDRVRGQHTLYMAAVDYIFSDCAVSWRLIIEAVVPAVAKNYDND